MTIKEKRLNELFSDYYDEDEAVEELIYLTSKERTHRTTENHIRECYRNGTLGTLLKRLDPIAYNAEE